MTDPSVTTEASGTGSGPRPRSAGPRSRSIDRASLVAGLIFVVLASAALTDRFWVDIDAALVFGGAIVVTGAALMVSAVRRHRRADR